MTKGSGKKNLSQFGSSPVRSITRKSVIVLSVITGWCQIPAW